MITLILEFSLLFVARSSNIMCVGPQCSYCLSGVLYNSTCCLIQCPEGYSSVFGTCVCNTSPCDANIFAIRFYQNLNFTTNTVGPFVAPTVFSASNLAPIPTKERGFYFNTTSSMQSLKNWTIGPDFTFSFTIRVTNCTSLSGNCTIFAINNPGIVFKLQVTNTSELISTWLLTNNQDYSTVNQTITTDFPFGSWFKMMIGSIQSQYSITLYHTYTNDNEIASTSVTIDNNQFYNQDNFSVSSFGEPLTSFQGFIYDVRADNYVYLNYEISAFLVDCNFNEYYINPQCKACNNTCPSWPWCTHSGVCAASTSGACYSPSCTNCTGFDYNSCTTCSNSALSPGTCDCWKFCSGCSSTFECTACDSRYTLIGGLCIYEPYNWGVPGPAISLQFHNFDQYYDDLFQNGHDPSTWAPFQYPDMDDPIPVLNRGLYFNGFNYLVSNQKISLSFNNSFYIWAQPFGNGFNFWNAPSILLFSDATASYLLTDSYTWTRFNTYYVGNVTEWTLFSFIHSFSDPITSATIALNGVTFSSFSMNGYVLYDIKTFVYILGQGFLYSINIFNTVVNEPFTDLVCTSGLSSNCIWNCNLNQYYNGNSCVNCDSACLNGCSTSQSCSICVNATCLSCVNDSTTECTSIRQRSTTNSVLCSPTWIDYEYNSCCEQSCTYCDGPYYYSCTMCPDFDMGGICVSQCPSGFYAFSAGICEEVSPLIIDFTFTTIYDTYVNATLASKFHTGINSSFYPELTPSDPIPVDGRGLYFLSTSYITSSEIMFSSNFTIVVWIKHQNAGVLLRKGTLLISLGSFVSVTLTNSTSFTVDNYFYANEWTQFAITVYNNYRSVISALVSTLSEKIMSYSGTYDYFLDTYSSLTVGDLKNSFTGFIYRLQVYNNIMDLSSLSVDTVCTVGLVTDCVWDCDVNEYWNGYYCAGCISRCDMGCRAGDYCNICWDVKCHYCHDYVSTCDVCKDHASFATDSNCVCDAGFYWELAVEKCLPCNSACVLCTGPSANDCVSCADQNCLYCSGFGLGTCTQCGPGFAVIDSRCVPCNSTQYYDSKTLTCETCPLPCYTCQSDRLCETCIQNSTLNIESICECDLGFYLTTSCERTSFTSLFSISNQNVIRIMFTEPLNRDLQTSDLIVTITDYNVTISLSKIDQSTWILNLNLNQQLETGARVTVDIPSNLVSVYNSIFVDHLYSALLFTVEIDQTAQAVLEAQSLASTTLAVVFGTVFGCSLLMFNPSSFFFFMQALEMYYYVMIYVVNISPELSAFLNALNSASFLPNPLSFLIDNSYGVTMTGKLNDFGYNTNLFLLNSGINIVTIILFAVFYPICWSLTKVEFKPLQNKAKQWVRNYKYRVFARFYTQVFLEFVLNCSIGIYFTLFENPVQIFDTILCSVTFLVILSGLGALIKLIIKRNEDPDNEEFMTQWGTFFEELKGTPNTRLFYAFYFVRRFTIACVIMFIPSDLGQLVVSIAVTFSIPIYVLAFKPFVEMSTNVYIVCSELMLISFYMDLMVGILSMGAISIETTGLAGIKISIGALIISALYSIYQACKSLYEKYQEKKAKKIVPIENRINITQEIGNPVTSEFNESFNESKNDFNIVPFK